MSSYEIKKVENCISKSSVFQYRFSFKVTDDFINMFQSSAELKVHRNFPKPSFDILFPDRTKIVGVLRDVAFKAMFPLESADVSKNKFETLLTEIVKNYTPEGR